jgi:hypothetical protein
MKKDYIPQIRVISVDHERTSLAERRLRHALDAHDLRRYPVRSVFCHLESGRCGVSSGQIAVEVDGGIIWKGKEITEKLAESFAAGLPDYVLRQMRDLGLMGDAET